MKKKVTVSIPVYNGEKYILETLQSILGQNVKIDQVNICDNRSTDRTMEIIMRFIENNPQANIRIYQNEVNIGAAPNFRKCLELCDTDFMVILGADDRLRPDAIEKQMKLFKEIPELGLVGGFFQAIDHEGKMINEVEKRETIIFKHGDILELAKQTKFYFNHNTVMYNMECTRKVGLLDPKYIGSDERYYAAHILYAPIAQIGEALVEVRFHPEQETHSENSRFKDKIEHFEANLKMANLESSPERIRKTQKILKDWIAAQAIGLSHSIWKNFGEKQLAIKYWFYGLKKNPLYYFKRYTYGKIKVTVKRILN